MIFAKHKHRKTIYHIEKDFGYSMATFRSYIESKFLPGMTWDNDELWTISYIIPLCNFNLSNPEQLKSACHYTNLHLIWNNKEFNYEI